MVAPHKIFYKGKEFDFVVFIEDLGLLKRYLGGDTTLPLIDIVSIYKIFINRQGGSEGVLDEASKQELSEEFGKLDKDEIIKKIIKEGSDKKVAGFSNDDNSLNDSNGSRDVGH